MNTHSFFHRHFFIAMISIPTLGWVAQHTLPHSIVNQRYSYQNKQFSYTPRFFKLVTMGYWPAAVEGMWISVLQKTAENQLSQGAADEVIDFYNLATDLDPLFYELYEQAGVFYSFFRDDGKTATHFYEKGIKAYETVIPNKSEEFRNRFWNHPYTLYIFNAYSYGFELNDWPKSKLNFLKAAEVPGAPPYLQKMKVWLKEEGSEKILAGRILNLLIQNTKDEEKKKKFEEKLAKLKESK